MNNELKNINKFDGFVLLSDIHFGLRSDSIEWLENIKSYFYNFFIPNFKTISNNKKIALIIAGDVFDNRQKLDIDIMNTAQNIFNDILNINKNIEIFCISGNHDLYRKKKIENKSIKTSLNCLINNRFHVILEPISVTLKNDNELLFLPWVGDNKTENEIIKNSKANIIIMHSDINGASYDNGRQITNGVNIDISKAKKIYSGHIHKRQEYNKFIYIGTPYQTKRSDIGNDKGLYYILLDDKSFSDHFIINDYSPKFIKLKIEDLLELPITEIIKMINNNYVDIIIKDIHLKYFSVSKLMDAIKDSNYKKIEIIVDKTNKIVDSGDVNFDSNVSIDTYIQNHIKALEGISDEDKQQLLSLNNKYINQFNQM